MIPGIPLTPWNYRGSSTSGFPASRKPQESKGHTEKPRYRFRDVWVPSRNFPISKTMCFACIKSNDPPSFFFVLQTVCRKSDLDSRCIRFVLGAVQVCLCRCRRPATPSWMPPRPRWGFKMLFFVVGTVWNTLKGNQWSALEISDV